MDIKKVFKGEPPERIILRIGLGLTILWFGINQLINPSSWTGYVPIWVDSFLPFLTVEMVVYMNGAFETILSLALIFNKFVRLSSLLLGLHLILIILDLGITEIGVRDFGILVGFAALYFMREKKLSGFTLQQ